MGFYACARLSIIAHTSVPAGVWKARSPNSGKIASLSTWTKPQDWVVVRNVQGAVDVHHRIQEIAPHPETNQGHIDLAQDQHRLPGCPECAITQGSAGYEYAYWVHKRSFLRGIAMERMCGLLILQAEDRLGRSWLFRLNTQASIAAISA
jgi:hypothetical protein